MTFPIYRVFTLGVGLLNILEIVSPTIKILKTIDQLRKYSYSYIFL